MRSEFEPLSDPLHFAMSPVVQRPVMSPADFAWDTEDYLPVPDENEGNDE